MTDLEKSQLTSLLSKLEAGFLPYEIFMEVARLVALPITEFVPLRSINGVTEVLLIERDEDDTLFKGELHIPGTVVRSTDVENFEVFKRILQDELKGTPVSAPHYVGNILHRSRRGAEQAQVYWVEVTGAPNIGSFYPIKNLPVNTMQSQVDFILQAAGSFEEFKAL